MKRIATAAVAATLSLSALSAPAFAADADTAPAKENQGSSAQAEGDQAGEKVGSSEVYKKCKEGKILRRHRRNASDHAKRSGSIREMMR